MSDQLIDVKQFFGLTHMVLNDPAWIWFRDPQNYSPVLAELGLDEGTYLDVWDEIMRVFPLHWARDTREGKARICRDGGFTPTYVRLA